MRFFCIILASIIAGAIAQGQLDNNGVPNSDVSSVPDLQSVAPSVESGGSVDGNVQIDNCLALQGGVGGSASGQGDLSGNVNVGAQGSNKKCRCKNGKKIGPSGNANVGVDGQGGVSANGDVSVNMPSANCGVPVETTTTPTPSFTYNIQYRMSGLSTAGRSIQVRSGQYEITYNIKVDADQPLTLESYIQKGNNQIFDTPRGEGVSICGNYEENTLDYLFTRMYNLGLTPNGTGCPIEPGTYTVPFGGNINYTQSEMLQCGEYIIGGYVDDANKNGIFGFTWIFTIPNGDNCIPI